VTAADDHAHPRRPAGGPSDPAEDVRRAHSGMRNARSTYGRPDRRRRTAGDRWSGFVYRYGWRAYAVPALVIVSVIALVTAKSQSSGHPPPDRHAVAGVAAGPKTTTPSSPPTASGSISLKQDNASGNINPTVLKAAALPPGPAYTMKGTGTFRVLKGTSPVVGHGKLYRYDIEVEDGITGIDLTQFANDVVTTLSDPRSWSGHGVALKRVDSGPVDFHVGLTSALTVRKLCGYAIPVETSCYAPAGSADGLTVNRVVLDDARWVRGATAYVGNVAAYRQYMINHEDGHALGHEHAHECLPGGLAPTMMQQTFGLRSAATGKFCEANPWPYPTGVKGAPGAEQPDTAANDEYGRGD
jgi:hypothetical protein